MKTKIKLWSKEHQQSLKKLLKYYSGNPDTTSAETDCLLCETTLNSDGIGSCERCYWFLYEYQIKNSIEGLYEHQVKIAPCEQWFRNQYYSGVIGFMRENIHSNDDNSCIPDSQGKIDWYKGQKESFKSNRIAMLQEAIEFWKQEINK